MRKEHIERADLPQPDDESDEDRLEMMDIRPDLAGDEECAYPCRREDGERESGPP